MQNYKKDSDFVSILSMLRWEIHSKMDEENFSQIDVRLKMGVEQCDFHSRREYPPVTNGFSRTTHEKFISKYISFKVV